MLWGNALMPILGSELFAGMALRAASCGRMLNAEKRVFGHFELRRTDGTSNVRNRACFSGSIRIGEVGPVDVSVIVMGTIVMGAIGNCHDDN
jgi:hypothetical protein